MSVFKDSFKNLINKSVKIFLLLFSMITVILLLYFAIMFFSAQHYENNPRQFTFEIPQFKIELKTIFRPYDFGDAILGYGDISYNLNLIGYIDKYNYDQYDDSVFITIYFLDKNRFKISEEKFFIKNLSRRREDGVTLGFRKLGSDDRFSIYRLTEYKKIADILVGWRGEFKKI